MSLELTNVGQVNVANTAAGGGVVSNVNLVNSAGWITGTTASQAGVWTVQPGNTINTSAWLMNQANTGGNIFSSQSGTWIVQPGNNINTSAWLVTAAQSGVWNITNTVNSVSIINSGGWLVNVANTAQSVNIINSSGWAINQINTAGQTFYQINTGGNIFASQSGPWNIANTGGNIFASQSGTWTVFKTDSRSTGTAVSLIVSTVGQVVLLTANTNRLAASIYNQSTNPLFIRLGSNVSATTYSLMMVSSGYYEVPAPTYTGIITGIWVTANGQALITEGT